MLKYQIIMVVGDTPIKLDYMDEWPVKEVEVHTEGPLPGHIKRLVYVSADQVKPGVTVLYTEPGAIKFFAVEKIESEDKKGPSKNRK